MLSMQLLESKEIDHQDHLCFLLLYHSQVHMYASEMAEEKGEESREFRDQVY